MNLKNMGLIVAFLNIFKFRKAEKIQLHNYATFSGNLLAIVKQKWENLELRKSMREVTTIPHCPKSPGK